MHNKSYLKWKFQNIEYGFCFKLQIFNDIVLEGRHEVALSLLQSKVNQF